MTFRCVPFEEYPGNLHLAVRTICKNMRQSDLDEVRGILGPAVGWVQLANNLIEMPGLRWICYDDADPPTFYGVGGLVPIRNGVLEGWILGTDNFKKAYIPLTRMLVRDMIPGIKAGGTHRLFCNSIATHSEAHRWLELMGAELEGVARGFGACGEDFMTYAWRF